MVPKVVLIISISRTGSAEPGAPLDAGCQEPVLIVDEASYAVTRAINPGRPRGNNGGYCGSVRRIVRWWLHLCASVRLCGATGITNVSEQLV